MRACALKKPEVDALHAQIGFAPTTRPDCGSLCRFQMHSYSGAHQLSARQLLVGLRSVCHCAVFLARSR